MSYAWHQLRCAVKALNRTTCRRDRLAIAYSKLVRLRAKDLPAQLVDDFERLVGGIPRYPAKHVFREIRSAVDALSDAEVAEAFSLISAMHDVLETYQPRHWTAHCPEVCPACVPSFKSAEQTTETVGP